MNSVFTIKDNKVYFKEKHLKKISAEEFETLSFSNEYQQAYVRCIKDKKGIWFVKYIGKGSVKFLSSDVDGFSFIDEDYARDRKNVYLVAKDGFLIPNSDAETFKVITETPYFAKDKNQLYALDEISGLSIYRHADVDSILNGDFHQFVTDKHNLYHYGVDVNLANDQKYLNFLDASSPYDKRGGKPIFESNKEFFHKRYPNIIGWWHSDYPFKIDIENISQLGFYKTKNAVFYLEENFHLEYSVPTLLSKANVASFKTLNENYGIDNKSVFYQSIAILDADAKTFKLVNSNLAKDKNNYYYNGNTINCDYKSFKIMSESRMFYKDNNTLFSVQEIREGKVGMRYEIKTTLVPIKNSSPETMEILSSMWAKDENQVYVHGKPFKKADVNTFEYLHIKSSNGWAKDKNDLYCSIGHRIKASSFQVLNKFWGKDEDNIIFFPTDKIVSSADLKTFKITNDIGGSIDKSFVYSIDESGSLKKNKK